MSLASPFVSKEVYNDAKLLIEGLNKYAGSEDYAVVTERFKKFKKDVDRIVYIRCDREGKASLNSEGFERRLHSDTRLMKCSFSAVDKRNEDDDWYFEVIRNESHIHTSTLTSAHSALRKLIMTEKSINSLTKAGVEVSHGQGVKGSEVNVLPHPLPFKRMQACCSVSYVAKKVLIQRY